MPEPLAASSNVSYLTDPTFTNIREISDVSAKNKQDMSTWVSLMEIVLDKYKLHSTWRQVCKQKISQTKSSVIESLLNQSEYENWDFKFFAAQLQHRTEPKSEKRTKHWRNLVNGLDKTHLANNTAVLFYKYYGKFTQNAKTSFFEQIQVGEEDRPRVEAVMDRVLDCQREKMCVDLITSLHYEKLAEWDRSEDPVNCQPQTILSWLSSRGVTNASLSLTETSLAKEPKLKPGVPAEDKKKKKDNKRKREDKSGDMSSDQTAKKPKPTPVASAETNPRSLPLEERRKLPNFCKLCRNVHGEACGIIGRRGNKWVIIDKERKNSDYYKGIVEELNREGLVPKKEGKSFYDLVSLLYYT